MTARDQIYHIVRVVGEFFEDQWFDRTRNIRTSGDVSLRAAGIAAERFPDSEWYVPARPRHIRRALVAMPVEDVSGCTYIDLGCGKGRSLFVAAEYPFRQIIGVELSARLAEQSQVNVRRFRPFRRGVKPDSKWIRSVQQNARDFAFPPGDLVLYLFNPFGRDTMQQVLRNLDAARRKHPCRVVVILLWPRCGDMVAALEGMQLRSEAKQYQIFASEALEAVTVTKPDLATTALI